MRVRLERSRLPTAPPARGQGGVYLCNGITFIDLSLPLLASPASFTLAHALEL